MLKKIFFLILLMATPAFSDEAADKAEFKKLYAEFNDLYANSEDIDPIIEVAEKLIEIAPKAYGKNHMNTAVVTYNLASLYDEKGINNFDGDINIKAAKLYKRYFEILDDNNKPKDRIYINQYLQYIKTQAFDAKSKSINSNVNKIINFARDINFTNSEMALLEFNVGLLLFKNNDFKVSTRHFEEASKLYEIEYGPDFFKLGEAEFWIAKLEMGKKRKKSAEMHFLKALKIFEKNPEISGVLKQNTHAFLVALYEEMNRSDDATLHCQAVAEERPKNFDQFIKPLYRKNPNYPSIASLNGATAEVILQFDVDTNGFTKNVKVIESSSKAFNANSIKAAKAYRYAPSIRDGELIETKGARVKILYRMAKR